MNTTEHIVEAFFRTCRNCFTLPDIKIMGGNNRQIDLLAYNYRLHRVYHVETSVTHCERWCPTVATLEEHFDYKFFGKPRQKEGTNSDYARGKTYKKQIYDAYGNFGINANNIYRVWCCWIVPIGVDVDGFIGKYCKSRGIAQNPIEVLSFRDEVIPALQKQVGTSHYEDDVLRTFSLLREYTSQIQQT